VNEIFSALGLLDWKPVIGALLLPPVPLLVILLLACRSRARRPVAGGVVMLLTLAALWFSLCEVTGAWLERRLSASEPITPAQATDWRRALAGRKPVVLVLGGGAFPLAPEYGESHLTARSMERLHYGLWLARQLQAPVMVSGGAGLAGGPGPAEADVAARIASRDFGRPLRWQETASRDTRENARQSLQLLRNEGITEVFLVTHSWHMRRALRAFANEAALTGFGARIVPAPMGQAAQDARPVLRWLPSPEGYRRVYQALREMIGLLAGA